MLQKLKNIYHLLQALFANIMYGFPSRGLTVVGVTGTDGKTTTSSILYHILATAGKKAALITSVGATINGKTSDTGFHVTTPDSFALQKYLKKAKDSGSQIVVLETTSHGLDQNRVWGIQYAIGVITNITQEHLDYHKTYDNYVRTKTKLLERAQVAIVNKDDEQSYKRIMKILPKSKHVITYALHQPADFTLQNVDLKTTLPGEFNQYNCLAAWAVARELGVVEADIATALATFALPEGREEIVYDKEFTVMIDFAHTPNAMEKILRAVRPMAKHGRVIHVFGSAGERDQYKRPLMGKWSGELADVSIITAEDPRSEDVNDISNQIVKGIEENPKKEILKIPDRQEAINHAIEIAKKGDVVVITGKGHEKSMNFGKGETHWDDHEAVEKALKKR